MKRIKIVTNEFLSVSVPRVWRSFGIERAALIFDDFEKKKDVEDLKEANKLFLSRQIVYLLNG